MVQGCGDFLLSVEFLHLDPWFVLTQFCVGLKGGPGAHGSSGRVALAGSLLTPAWAGLCLARVSPFDLLANPQICIPFS